jgi:hypothetical protein
VLSLLAMMAFASPARAQYRRRSGVWLDAGAGIGRLRVSCRTCSPPASAGGYAIDIAIGGAMSKYVLLGVEGQVWTGSDAHVDEQVRTLSVVAQWYPWPKTGFFVRFGTGLVDGHVAPNDSVAVRTAVKGKGVVMGVSLGWDQPISRHLAITAQAGDQIAALGDITTASGGLSDDTIAYVSRLSIALTLR